MKITEDRTLRMVWAEAQETPSGWVPPFAYFQERDEDGEWIDSADYTQTDGLAKDDDESDRQPFAEAENRLLEAAGLTHDDIAEIVYPW